MNKFVNNSFKFLHLIKIFGVVIILGSLFISGCSSTSASEKKAKLKKSKSVEITDEEANSDEETANQESKQDTDKSKTNSKLNSNIKLNSNSKEIVNKTDSTNKKSNSKEESKKAETKKVAEKVTTFSADEIWADLIKGNKRFMSGKHTAPNYISMRKTLVDGQHPPVIVLGCSDSRVPPELIFDKNLGEIFVVRDAGNIADEITLGSIEYAIEQLHAKVLVVLGHESCGAVASAVSGEEMPSKNLQAIVDRISSAFEDSKDCPIGGKINLACVELNVKQSALDIAKESPIIKKAAKEGLTIIKAVYHLETGEVVRVD